MRARWERDVESHDFDSALAYLTLRFDAERAGEMVARLREAKVTIRRANDILRACDRTPLPKDDPGVQRTLRKIRSGRKLSPILVVSFDVGADIADGYHRASVSYLLDPFGDVPLRIASLS